jgi:hypothetical protein
MKEVDYVKTSKNILKRHWGNPERIEYLCAVWMMRDECFNYYKPQLFPKKPVKVVEYEEAVTRGKDIESKFFKDFPEVNEYYKACQNIALYNYHRIKQLFKYRKILSGKYEDKINDRLVEFQEAVSRNGQDIVLPIFNKQEYKKTTQLEPQGEEEQDLWNTKKPYMEMLLEGGE